MTITIEARRDSQGGDLVVIIGGWRRFRLGAYYGPPPGSHIGLWRTPGLGWNLRVGKRYLGPCLTLLAHTRRLA